MPAATKRNNWLNKVFPFLPWMKSYKLSFFKNDLLAGITVTLILIPQSMAYAILAGLPPIMGLYAAAITPVIASFWGSLRQLSTGPVAILSLLVLTTLSTMAKVGSPQYIEMAVTLTLLIGIIKTIIGAFKLSIILSFTSLSIVKGFTSAVALIIMSTQLPNLLGVKVSTSQYIIPTLYNTILELPNLHLPAFIIGLSSLLIIFFLRKVKHLPSGLLALLLATVITFIFKLDLLGVPIVGYVQEGIPLPRIPDIDMHIISPLIGPALVMALISIVETYSISKTISFETKQKIDWNKEFIGQGIANIVGSFFYSTPVSGSFARSTLNYKTGAKTALSSAITSFGVFIALWFFTSWLYYIPKSALAAMVISAVFFLFHPRQVFRLYKKNRDDGIVAITVFILALLTRPDYALLMGITISLVFFMWKSMHPRIIRVTRDLSYKVEINGDELDKPSCPQIFHIRSDNSIFFANAEYTIENMDMQLEKASPETKFLILDFESVAFVDITAIEEIRIFKEDLEKMGIKLAVMGLHIPVEKVFRSTGFIDEIEKDLIFENRNELIPALFKKIDHDFCRNNCPYSLFRECVQIKSPTKNEPVI